MPFKSQSEPLDLDLGVDGSKSGPVEQIGVQSVEVAGRLLKVLATLDGPQTLSRLSFAAGLPPAKAHRYLVSLIRVGLVEQSPADGRYDFGGAARLIGRVAMNRLDVMRIGSPLLNHLREVLNETVFLGVWTQRGPIVLECLDVPRPVAVVVRRGSTLPILTSAFGLVCAAFLPPSLVEPFIKSELPNSKGSKSAASKALASRLDGVRDVGYSVVRGEVVKGLDAVAVPVLDQSGEFVACLAAVGLSGELNVSRSGPVIQELRAAAHKFAQSLG